MRPCCDVLKTRRDLEHAFPQAAWIAGAVRSACGAHDLPAVVLHGGCLGSRAVLARALLEEAVVAGSTQATPGWIDCSAPDDEWRPLLSQAEASSRSAAVTTSLRSGRCGAGGAPALRKVAVLSNVDAVGCASLAGSSHSVGSSMAAQSFIKSCVETSSPGCWWIMTASTTSRVPVGVLSGAVLISAVSRSSPRPPQRLPTQPPDIGRFQAALVEATRSLAAASVESTASAGAERHSFGPLISAVRRSIDAMISWGFGDSDILRAALDGMTGALGHSDRARHALVETFADYSARTANCRRAVWKGCIAEQCVLDAALAAVGEILVEEKHVARPGASDHLEIPRAAIIGAGPHIDC